MCVCVCVCVYVCVYVPLVLAWHLIASIGAGIRRNFKRVKWWRPLLCKTARSEFIYPLSLSLFFSLSLSFSLNLSFFLCFLLPLSAFRPPHLPPRSLISTIELRVTTRALSTWRGFNLNGSPFSSSSSSSSSASSSFYFKILSLLSICVSICLSICVPVRASCLFHCDFPNGICLLAPCPPPLPHPVPSSGVGQLALIKWWAARCNCEMESALPFPNAASFKSH